MGARPNLIMGDFNCVLHYSEKKGGRLPIAREMAKFQQAMEDCNVNAVHYIEGKFSWCNNRKGEHRILAKLDRAFVNQELETKYSDGKVKTLPCIGPDHAPLFGSSLSVPKPSNVPFKYNAGWVSHGSFLSTVK